MNQVLSSSGRFAGLEEVVLKRGEILHSAGQRLRHVYFPDGAVISLLTTRAQGQKPVEVGLIGHEGMLGVALALGVEVSAVRAEVQGSGRARRATVATFTEALGRNEPLRRRVLNFSHALTVQVMQTAACNRNHNIEQRVARWLLMLRDRASRDTLDLTQKYLSYMVGVRRAGINEAAGVLQRRELIRWRRGAIEILDARGLEAASCSCYRVLKE